MPMAEVQCKTCSRPFIASTIEAAMTALRAHERVDHREYPEKARSEITWTKWDLRFLDFCEISPD